MFGMNSFFLQSTRTLTFTVSVGCFAATGVPLMGVAMGNIASMVISVGDPGEAERLIAAKVTAKELHMMQKFDLDNGDGQISRAEYILLCSVRLGALSPDLIDKINDRFKALDKSRDGTLDYAEILECPEEMPRKKPMAAKGAVAC
jgi:hypothetical protein